MAKNKMTEDEIMEDEELPELEETTDTEMAEDVAAEETAMNENLITLNQDDIPEAADLDVGNSINVTAELTLRNRNDDGTTQWAVTDILTPGQEEELQAQEEESATPMPGGGLEGLLGGGGPAG